MKRPIALLVVLAFLAMLGLDSNACYLLMLTCHSSAACSASEEPEVPACQSPCARHAERCFESAATPAESEEQPVCAIPISTEGGIHQTCKCRLAVPPVTLFVAERKLLESHAGNKLNMTIAVAPEEPTHRILQRDVNLSSIHPAIATTVLRC